MRCFCFGISNREQSMKEWVRKNNKFFLDDCTDSNNDGGLEQYQWINGIGRKRDNFISHEVLLFLFVISNREQSIKEWVRGKMNFS